VQESQVASPTWTRALTLDRVNAISCSDDMTPSLQDGYRWIMACSHVCVCLYTATQIHKYVL